MNGCTLSLPWHWCRWIKRRQNSLNFAKLMLIFPYRNRLSYNPFNALYLLIYFFLVIWRRRRSEKKTRFGQKYVVKVIKILLIAQEFMMCWKIGLVFSNNNNLRKHFYGFKYTECAEWFVPNCLIAAIDLCWNIFRVANGCLFEPNTHEKGLQA